MSLDTIMGWFRLGDSVSEIRALSRSISADVKSLRDCNLDYKNTIKAYEAEVKAVREESRRNSVLLLSVIDQVEDMIWAKDMQGRYIMANKAFRNKFCYGMKWATLKYKTSKEITKILKKKVGSSNHTFGEFSDSSEALVIDTEEAREFIEHGRIDGKLVKLVITKSPVYDFEGTMFAICGTGKDVTKWHSDLEKVIVNGCGCFGVKEKEMLIRELNKLK